LKLKRYIPLTLILSCLLVTVFLSVFQHVPTVKASPTLLTLNSKYVVASTTAVATTSATLVNDTQAAQSFSLSTNQVVLVIYAANSVNGATMPDLGMQNAVSIDGVDYAKSWDAGGINLPTRNTVFWLGTLSSGSHTIKGRFASNYATETATVSNRVLIIIIFNGNEFQYVDDTTYFVSTSTSFVDDPYAQVTFTPSGGCKALLLYNAANSPLYADAPLGKKLAINVAGVDYGQAEKEPGDSDNDIDSVFTCHSLNLSAVETTVKGRCAVCKSGDTLKIVRRQLAVLLLADSTLMDVITSTTQVSTTSLTLVDDAQATINRVTSDTRELLVVAMGTKRYGTDSTGYGECYGIKIDANDRANSRGAPYASDAPDSASTCYAEQLSAGSHTVKGRFALNGGGMTAIIDARQVIALWFVLPNNAPTDDALTLDLTGANYKGTKTLLTAKQDYKFVYKCSDADGVTDITYAEIRLDYASKNVVLRVTRGTGDAWTFSEQSDPSNYVILGTCSESTSGTQKTFNFYVKINWAWGDSAETVGVRAYVIDSQLASDQDDYSNVFGVECHLASSSLSVNDYRVNPSQTLTMSGYWYYNGTAVIPPDGDYQVKIKLSGTQKGSTDTTLVSGAFSISDVAAESTVNSYTYQVFANYNASAGSFNAVVVDKARVYYEQLDDSRVNINANIEFRIKAILLYDNHVLGTGDTVTANFGSLTWDAGNNWFDGSRTQATVGSYVFQISSLSEATYGITAFEINVTDPTGVYDRIRIDSISVVDGRIDINTQGSFYAIATLEFDSHTLGTGDSLSLSGYAFTWISTRSRFEYNTTQSSVLHVTIDSFTSGNEATYGITVGDINSKSGTIIWDRIQVSFIANSTGPVLNEVVLFTVTLTREYDSSSISSYSYNINRNGSAFGNPHSTATFTDVQSSQITYVYDFVSVVDNTYGLSAFVDPSNITVTWTSTNVAPTIGDFSAPADVYAGQYIFVNATVIDADGRTQIVNATVQLSGTVILKWLNASNTFSIQSDPYNYVTLNQSACLRTILNDTAYLLSWNLRFAWNYSYPSPSVIVTNTKVYDMYSSYGSNNKSDLFAFKDDLIVASASVNPVETTPETNVVFNGTIYYYNTTTPPYTTGITVYLSLDGLLQGATTTVTSTGAWTKTMRCPATTGNKTYVVYVMTDEIGVANKTVNLFVMSTGPSGDGYFFQSAPIYRPENYTYTPPAYVPEEIAVPTGLEGLGLNILIIAVVGATVLGVGASVIKPSRPTLASKIHVKRASSTDYKKRLRRPKRKGA
jgi:hypothetical protein